MPSSALFESILDLPFGLETIDVNGEIYIMEDFDCEEESVQAIARQDHKNRLQAFALIDGADPISGKLVLSRKSRNQPLPPRGTIFEYDTDSDGTATRFVIATRRLKKGRNTLDTIECSIYKADIPTYED